MADVLQEEEPVQLVVTELDAPDCTSTVEEKDKYKCDVCNLNFYKRYHSPYQNAKSLELHLQKDAHKKNVERKKMGLEPEKQHTFTAVGKQLGDLVERLGTKIELLEGIIKNQTHRLETLESGSVRSWLDATSSSETVPADVTAEQKPPQQPEQNKSPPSEPNESLPPPMAARDKVLARCLETSQRFQQQPRDLSRCWDECSVGTTTTDIIEAEYTSSRQQPNCTGFAQTYSRQRNQRILETSFGEESSLRTPRSLMFRREGYFVPSDSEMAAVSAYDGKNYAAMTKTQSMLTRLMVSIKEKYYGDKQLSNLQYVQRTQTALNHQIRQRLNNEPRDDEETDYIVERLYTLLEHDWES